ncbi:MAG TPA: hypothetical protein VN673_18215, partial [Clostridia bacterium]|nr:hypothetical protein [Clostridia bacterium]
MRSPAFLAACLITFTSGAAAIASGFYLSEGDILAANYGGSSLLRINQATGEHRSIGTFSGPTDVALSASGDLYVSEWNGLVKRLRLADGETSVLNPNTTMNQVWGLVLGPSGDLYAASRRSNTIVRINPLSGQETIVSRGGLFQDLRGIEWIPPNLVVSSWSDNAVIAVDPLTGAQNDFCQGVKGIQGPWGIAEFNGSLYLGTYDSKILQRYSAGVLVNLASLPGYPIGVATSPAGEIFVGLSGVNAIVRVSPEGVILSTYAGGLIREVSGLQISPMSFVPSVTNTAPRLGSIAEKRAVIGQLLTFSAAASDEDLPVQKLTFSLEPGAPKGASTSPDGTFAW